jgi:RNA polymerase sigma-70 factor (ECF subfamily)
MTLDCPDELDAARTGDGVAYGRLVARHQRAVFQLCWRITRDEALAEDAAQEAFTKAWRALPEFDGRAAFGTWLHRIAVNAALEQLRRNARHRDALGESVLDGDADGEAAIPFLSSLDDDAPGPQEHAHAGELRQRIGAELSRLSGLERAAFVLRHVEGEPLETIAATLSLNIGQSKQAIFRAVRKLRGALQDWR